MTSHCIVIEALSALQGGGQTYLRNLFEHYEAHEGERVVAILSKEAQGFRELNPAIEVLTPEFPSRSIVHRLLWSRLALPRLLRTLKADVLYCPGGTLPTRASRGWRTAVAFQNALPFSPRERARYPLGYMRLRLWLLRYLQGSSFREADLVIFISRYAKSVIDQTIGHRKCGFVIIPHGLNDHFRVPQPRPRDPRLPEEYVLYVSILDVYKAQVDVVRAWRRLRDYRPTMEKLVLIGPEFEPYGKCVRTEIAKLGLQNEVLILGSVPYAELPAYYQHAKVNLFASSCENCPNILLEALAGGQPVLCSGYQPMPEFGIDTVQYFDPYDPESLADKLAKLLDDAVARVEWGERAARRAQDFQWTVAAGATWTALRDVALGTR
jgi:glycosyltransferase involved in cell wall biosynthesis